MLLESDDGDLTADSLGAAADTTGSSSDFQFTPKLAPTVTTAMLISDRSKRPACRHWSLILQHFILAFVCVVTPSGAPAQVAPRFWDRTVDQWIETARSNKDAENRRKAAFALGMLGTKAQRAVPTLIAMLHDSNDRVRREAAVALGEVGSGQPSVITALMKSLDDKHPTVVEAAAASLGEFGADARLAIESLIRVSERNINLSVPVESLCLIGEPAFEPLVQVLMDNQRPERFRIYIAMALPKYGEPAAEPLAELARTAHPLLRSKAVDALGTLGPVTEEVVPTLIEALQAPDASVRRTAANALRNCGPEAKAAIPILIANLEDGESAGKALVAMEAELQPYIPQLIERLLDDQSWVRHHAAKAISTLGPSAQGAVPALVRMLQEHPESEVSAITALGSIGPGAISALPAILERLEQHPLVVATAIAEMDAASPDVVERLVKLTASETPRARAEAIDALGVLGEAAIPALIALLSRLEDTGSYAVERGGSHGVVRQERVTVAESVPVALQKIGPAALPGLIQSLSHPEKRVRRLAIAAIGRIDGSREDAAAPLGAGLFDGDAHYRAAAAQALAAMGSDAAAAANELVRMFVSDPNVNNRVIAAHALGLLEDDHVTLRNAAAGALGRLRDAQSPDGARMLPGG